MKSKLCFCPYCLHEDIKYVVIRIINVTETGVAFKCMFHGYSGIRRDYIPEIQQKCFGEELNKIGMR